MDRAADLNLGAGFAGLSGDSEHGSTAGRHALGDRPVRTAYQYAQMAAKMAVEMSRCTALLIGVTGMITWSGTKGQ